MVNAVKIIDIDENGDGQRVDNYLFKSVKGVPKSKIYRCIRKGEVRVNGKRIKPEYRLQLSDKLRIPPLKVSEKSAVTFVEKKQLQRLLGSVLYEDEWLLVINKPSGVAVHGGSGVDYGVIEMLRSSGLYSDKVDLVHRLDRGTSGCLIIAKKRQALLAMQQLIIKNQIKKRYLALINGKLPADKYIVELPLMKKKLGLGQQKIVVSSEGRPSKTIFYQKEQFAALSMVEAILITGRMHQIRVHLSAKGFPIAGDEKYGDDDFNKVMKKMGLNRMFLHAASVEFAHPFSSEALIITAPISAQLELVAKNLKDL